jgi:DNA polymerase-3 subunit delta'
MPFREIAGHRAIVELLARAVRRDTLPPSLIFSGPEGVGKKRTAVALAQALNCLDRRTLDGAREGQPAQDACGACVACRRIGRGAHCDVILVEPEESGTIKVHQVRDVMERSVYRPFEGRRRVVIVDDAEALVEQAQNALLKILEEPPPASVFVLVTASPDVLLPTVRSRCPRLRFGRLSPADVGHVLQATGVPAAEAATLAAMADGSPGQALARRSGELADARDAAARLLSGVAATADPKRRLREAETFLGRLPRDRQRAYLALRIEALSTVLRDVQVLAAGADAGLLGNADLSAEVGTLARTYDPERVDRAFASAARALEALDRNAGVKVVADWIALQI